MRTAATWTIVAVIELIVCLPIAFIATILTSPFWGWYESRTGIESLGHSGPADWCFLLEYFVIAAVALIVTAMARKKS